VEGSDPRYRRLDGFKRSGRQGRVCLFNLAWPYLHRSDIETDTIEPLRLLEEGNIAVRAYRFQDTANGLLDIGRYGTLSGPDLREKQSPLL
jgi:hypothetical protein